MCSGGTRFTATPQIAQWPPLKLAIALSVSVHGALGPHQFPEVSSQVRLRAERCAGFFAYAVLIPVVEGG